MSFYGTSFIFDGIPCEEMGLIMYDFSNAKQSETMFSSDLTISEDRISGRLRPLMYGGSVNAPLTFNMVMCASEDSIYYNEPLDRWDLQKISSWLTGHKQYKWLEIVQPDMEDYRYRCIITELKAVEVAGNKWGLSCKVTCDSPYAYMKPIEYIINKSSYAIHSPMSYNDFYYPLITINKYSPGNLGIKISNEKEEYTFLMENIPLSLGKIIIDSENEIITCNSGLNVYQYIKYDNKFHFPRFIRGDNNIILNGITNCIIRCEWPVNIGC